MARKRHLLFCVVHSVLEPIGLKRSPLRWGVLAVFILLLVTIPAGATVPAGTPPRLVETTIAQNFLNQGRSLYDAGRFAEAAELLEHAVRNYRSQGDWLQEAIALSNLSLVYQQLGQWEQANEASQASVTNLQTRDRPHTLAQALEVQGRLAFMRGAMESALATWEQTATLYEQTADPVGVIRSQINQAEALQALGLYRRAITTLAQIEATSAATLESAEALRSLGDALRVAGDLDRSYEVLQQSLTQLRGLQNASTVADAIAATQFSLGNTVYTQGDTEAALQFYRQAAAGTATIQAQARLNQLRVLVEAERWMEADAVAAEILPLLDRLPPSRAAVFARINFVQSLLKFETPQNPSLYTRGAELLTTAVTQARALGDRRAESFALGNLGNLYERTQQFAEARGLTEQALSLAQQLNSADVTYLWDWQLGRILKAEGKRSEAIAAYSNAVNTLRSLRGDLVAVNAEVQFSFRDSIEPIHRQLVGLLLQTRTPSPTELEQARQTIESLQLAELDNFFREACLNARQVEIDQVDRLAAVIYPIILEDRLEVILSLPQADGAPSLRHYATDLPRSEVERTITQLRNNLRQYTANPRALGLSKQLYDWLIRPAAEELQTSGVKTLVFVLDGVLRNVPMAALHSGERYLLEDYAIALTPGLQLLEPQTLQGDRLNVLLAGLSESRGGFTSLPGVVKEFEEIQSAVPNNRLLLNQQFTNTAVQEAISAIPFPVVHLATHGTFSSRLEDTFILTWDDRIDINQLNTILQATDISRRRPIELLVLSACQTAEGDNRAALGLAGMAVRAGARSTIATLWQLSDDAAPRLMERFYQELATGVTKAEALRQAQLSLLNDPAFERPFFWSPLVLVGNWL